MTDRIICVFGAAAFVSIIWMAILVGANQEWKHFITHNLDGVAKLRSATLLREEATRLENE